MINPAEDVVNVWLQECHHHFMMSNIYVPAPHRVVKGRKIAGGRGPEVDFLSTDGKGTYIWTEVQVSFNPYVPTIDRAMSQYVKDAADKFEPMKLDHLRETYGVEISKKWFVYSPTMFPKRRPETEDKYRGLLAQKGIEAISFGRVYSEVLKKQIRMGYDIARQWLYLFQHVADSRMKL